VTAPSTPAFSQWRPQVETILPARPESVWRARDLLKRLLTGAGIDGEALHDSLLVASELVSNAVTHASKPGDKIQVVFDLRASKLYLYVTDAARGIGVPITLSPDEHRPGGRGLQIVESVADWSDRFVDGRREVSALLDLRSEPHR
jgi:anti-sigma regulatory factor (Ser/Thr protein kinase)